MSEKQEFAWWFANSTANPTKEVAEAAWAAWSARASRTEVAAPAWQPLASVPLGKMVMLTHRAWRHAWAGQVIDKETGECVLDSPTPEHAVMPHFAEHWMPLPSSPFAAHSLPISTKEK